MLFETLEEQTMTNHSIHIHETVNTSRSETHDLTKGEALEMAMNTLYNEDGKLISGIKLEIRTPKALVFIATNP